MIVFIVSHGRLWREPWLAATSFSLQIGAWWPRQQSTCITLFLSLSKETGHCAALIAIDSTVMPQHQQLFDSNLPQLVIMIGRAVADQIIVDSNSLCGKYAVADQMFVDSNSKCGNVVSSYRRYRRAALAEVGRSEVVVVVALVVASKVPVVEGI